MYRRIDFNCFLEKESALIALQEGVNCPFAIKRVFYIFDVPEGVVRGNHANRESQFLLIALKGSCKVCVDNGISKEEVLLESPRYGLHLEAMLWKQMYAFSKDCVLIVLSDTFYNKEEYINNYEEFCLLVRGGGGNTYALAA